MSTERYSRNEALFGAEGQRRIAATGVTIVGLGGLGSHVVQQLAYLGVRDYRLVDFDIVTDSSMNRLIGAVDADVAAQTTKIAVAERAIKAIIPNATVEPIDAKIDAPPAEAAIADGDVIFGCLDRDLPRLKLTELCARFAKPLFDLASDTAVSERSSGTAAVSSSRTAPAASSATTCSTSRRSRATACPRAARGARPHLRRRARSTRRHRTDGRVAQRRRRVARGDRVHGLHDRHARDGGTAHLPRRDAGRPAGRRRPRARLLFLRWTLEKRTSLGARPPTRICERVAFLRAGRIVDEGAPGELVDRHGGERLEDAYLEAMRP